MAYRNSATKAIDINRDKVPLAVGAGAMLAILILPVVSDMVMPLVVGMREQVSKMLGGK